MSTPDLSAKLPPPHDEEPAQLRSDILDELQDHLSCAVERERRRLQMSDQLADPASVWAAVIDRFGDPSALARRLWLDAMKGRLMTQRVLIGAVLVLTALLVVGGWSMTSTLSAVVEQNQKATAAILERLGKEGPATVSLSPEWISVKYRLVQGTKDGPPVVGQKVGFQQFATDGAGRLLQVSEVTNSEGVADFGLLPYGTYNLAISSPTAMMGERITLRPGRPIDEKIVVPNPVKVAHLKFEYSRPDLTNWKWRDKEQLQGLLSHEGQRVAGMSIEQLKEMITPCLCVKYGPQRPFEVDGRTWGSFASSKTLMVTPDGTFICGSNSTQESMIVSSAAVESVSVPAWEMKMQAEWYFRSGGTVDEFGLPGKDIYYRPLADCLDPVFTAENRRNAESSPDKMPVILKLESATDPQVIRFPVNHPALIDGTGIELAPYFGGFGGFNQ